jgi:hypothetical protein
MIGNPADSALPGNRAGSSINEDHAGAVARVRWVHVREVAMISVNRDQRQRAENRCRF